MSTKKVRCFTYSLKLEGKNTNKEYLKNVIGKLFESNEVKTVSYGNKAFIYKGKDDNNYLSLEHLTRIDDIEIDGKYLFFRIGREKDIEGAVKRNLETFEGKEIIDRNEQGSYNLEICTYILIDTISGIILEVYGQYAPTVRSLNYILNESFGEGVFKGLSFEYKNIVTEELVNALMDDGVRLSKIKYRYELPNVEVLNKLGMDDVQIQQLRKLDVFQVEVALRARTHIPLTKNSEKIKHTINVLKRCSEKIKKTLYVTGSTSNTLTKDYTFNEEEVTFNLDIPSTKTQDKLIIKLTLDEIAKEAYNRIKILYEGKNKERILEYVANA